MAAIRYAATAASNKDRIEISILGQATKRHKREIRKR
jgi:hypothetical protein